MNLYEYKDIRNLESSLVDKSISVEGRVHKIRCTKNVVFLILRYQNTTLQAICDKNTPELCMLTKESIIRVNGKLKNTPFPIKTTSYSNIELTIIDWKLISSSKELPFDIDDVDSSDDFRNNVGQSLRLDNRWLDLRVPVNYNIMHIQSSITNYFRKYLLKRNFIEIHTPKTIGVPSESGAEVFELNYFNSPAFLAQSPQLYKQMAINSDFDRVFEIGPVFRAENSFSSRHLCEYTGLDLEMTITPGHTYHEILEMIWSLLVYIFDNIKQFDQKYTQVIKKHLPFDDPIYTNEPFIIDYKDGVRMLIDDGYDQNPLEDLNTVNENRLGELVKAKYGVDLFILDKYPTAARPFYTMQTAEDANYTYSYDIIFRNKEICSGSQRINDYDTLISNIKNKGLNTSGFVDYLESFKYGSKPHGGCGFGLERILMLYLNLDNIRKASFCPRDPKRKTP